MQKLKGSYSQNKEDLVIDSLLGFKKKGFYVDIGAYDPFRFNNTCRFYKNGWNGINIEPDPRYYAKLQTYRKSDLNINAGIGLKNDKMILYRMIPDTSSTFSKTEMERYIKLGYILESTITVQVHRLDTVLKKYCNNKLIDFFSIDTEGFEMDVLRTNDWVQFKPKLICIESFTHSRLPNKNNKAKTEIKTFLSALGYVKVHENDTNQIFKLSNKTK